MLKVIIEKIYSDKINNFILLLSILPFFSVNWNYPIQIYLIFFLYFVIDFIMNLKNQVYKNNRILWITDFLSLLSLLPQTRLFVLFRFFRIIRLLFKIKSFRFIISIYRKNWPIIRALLYVSLIYMICVSLILFNIEPETFDNQYLNALYWSGITLTTVGYGDFYPVSVLGKFFALIASFIGIAIVALPTGFIASEFINRLNNIKLEKKQKFDEEDMDK